MKVTVLVYFRAMSLAGLQAQTCDSVNVNTRQQSGTKTAPFYEQNGTTVYRRNMELPWSLHPRNIRDLRSRYGDSLDTHKIKYLHVVITIRLSHCKRFYS